MNLAPLLALTLGLTGQPKPEATTVAAIRSAAQEILQNGDIGRARPALFTAVEKAVTTDLTPELATVVAENITYSGLIGVFEDAIAAKKDKEARFVRYNLAELHLLRSRLLRGEARESILRQASKAASGIDTTANDPMVFELLGDIAAERGDVDGAATQYRRMTAYLGSAAPAWYRIGLAHQKNNRPNEAQQAFEQGIRADAQSGQGGRLYKHLLYQGLGSLQFTQGRYAEALQALAQSTKVQTDTDSPFRFRLGLAQALLKKGYSREVRTYAAAAVQFDPEDTNAQAFKMLADSSR